MCSHWGQALGLYKEVPLPTILCFIFQSDVQRWEISPVTCRNAAPLWQIGFPWTTSLNQHFPSLLCPFQIFCYNNETVAKIETYCHSAVWADMSSIKCALTSHTENRTTKCDGWSKLLTLLGLKFSYWLSALSGRQEGCRCHEAARCHPSPEDMDCDPNSEPKEIPPPLSDVWLQRWTNLTNTWGLPKRFAKSNSKSKP